MAQLNFGFRVDSRNLTKLKDHKYSGQDDSLIAYYILQPYWNFITKYVPLWVAPNLLTLFGLISVAATLSVAFIYSPTRFIPLPCWMYFLIAFGRFCYQSLDAIDGKQARRTNSSSPLGELFDHGCDALNVIFAMISLAYSVLLDFETVMVLLAFTFYGFYIVTLDTYYTGTLYLGYVNTPVEGELVIIFAILLSGLYGPHIWDKESLFQGYSWRDIFKTAIVLAGILTMINSITRMIKRMSPKWRKTYKQPLLQVIFDLLKLLPISIGSISWVIFGDGLIKQQPIISLFMVGLGFSHIIGRLLVSHVLHLSVDLLILPQIFCVFGGIYSIMKYNGLFFLDEQLEMMFFIFSFLFNLIHYIHFIAGIMNQFSSYLGIYCFSLKKPLSNKLR